MHSINRRRLFLAAAAASAAPWAFAQDSYPSRPIQLIHGFGAGGNADQVARLVAQKLQDRLKQPVVVDIKSGAGGVIASSYVAKASPDGYNIVMLTGAHTVSAALRKTLPYDPIKDFAFISRVSAFPFVVAVRAEHPAKTLAQLLDMAKKEPGKVTFSSVGVGSTQHMVGELLGSAGNVELLHIPYRGGGAPVQAVIAGDVDILVDTLTVAATHIKSGRLRALGITSAAAWPSLPGVVPVSATLANFEVLSWLGLAAPAGTPASVVQLLNQQLRLVLQEEGAIKMLQDAGSGPAPNSPEQMRDMIQTDIGRWREVIVKAGIKTE